MGTDKLAVKVFGGHAILWIIVIFFIAVSTSGCATRGFEKQGASEDHD